MGILKQAKKLFPKKKAPKEKEKTVPSNELLHINQELYKKSAELAERNKALSLLGKIDEIILDSITRQDIFVQQIASLLVREGGFEIAEIFVFDKPRKTLRKQGLSEADHNKNPATERYYLSTIPLSYNNNLIVRAVKEKKVKIVHTLTNVIFPSSAKKIADKVQKHAGIQSIFISPLVARRQVIGALVICLTYTEQELLEYQRNLLDRLGEIIGIAIDNARLYNEVKSVNDKLKNANTRLKVLDKLKNEFVSVSAHELRTPMSAIRSYLWMALNGKAGALNEKQKYYVQRGYNSVDRLIRLVNDMLNISRIESGRITIDLQSSDLVMLTQEVVDEVLPRAKEVGVSIIIQKPASLPPVLADSDKIKEVFFNLIGNSLKFTPKGGSITISYAKKGEFIETKVTDNGVGIAPENVGKLFQKFGLLPGSYITNQTTMGTGLGLYICRSIIDLHQGEIKATSEGRGKGTTMTFTLKVFSDADLHNLKTEKPENKKEKMSLIHVEI